MDIIEKIAQFNFSTAKLIIRMVGVSSLTGLCLCLAACNAAEDHQSIKTVNPTLEPLSNIFEVHTLHIASGEWSPYTGKDLPHYGCDSWVVSEAFELERFSVVYGFFPWARSLHLSSEGTWDGTMEWDDTPVFREAHYISNNYLSQQEWVFFYRNDEPFDWHVLDDLAGKKIGITSGYVYSDAFDRLIKENMVEFEEASSDEANFKKLLLGRIDIFPMERQVGYAILEKNFNPEEISRISAHPAPFKEFHPHVLLSKAIPENAERIKLFDSGFEKLKQNGRYEEIMHSCLPDNSYRHESAPGQ